jgi:hypothetical protein
MGGWISEAILCGQTGKATPEYVYQRDMRILENWRRENLHNFEYIMVLLYYR